MRLAPFVCCFSLRWPSLRHDSSFHCLVHPYDSPSRKVPYSSPYNPFHHSLRSAMAAPSQQDGQLRATALGVAAGAAPLTESSTPNDHAIPPRLCDDIPYTILHTWLYTIRYTIPYTTLYTLDYRLYYTLYYTLHILLFYALYYKLYCTLYYTLHYTLN